MTVEMFVHMLSSYPEDMEIMIECPNGMLVEPKIRYIREMPFMYDSAIKSLVLTGRE